MLRWILRIGSFARSRGSGPGQIHAFDNASIRVHAGSNRSERPQVGQARGEAASAAAACVA